MHLATTVVVLVAFSVLVTLLLAPLQARLLNRGMRSSVALVICLVAYVGVLAVAAIIVVIGLADLVANLDSYRNALQVALDRLFGPSDLAQQLSTVLADAAE